MSDTVPHVDRKRSFLRLVCPFRFRAASLPVLIGRAEQHRGGREPLWKRIPYHDLLSGTGGYVNANNVELSAAGVWELSESFRRSDDGLAAHRVWHFRIRKMVYVVSLKTVELALFGTGVGFVIFEFAVRSLPKGLIPNDSVAQPTLPATWIDLAKILRRGELYHSPHIIHAELDGFFGPGRTTGPPPVPPLEGHCLRDDVEVTLATVGLRLVAEPPQALVIQGDEAVASPEMNVTFVSLFLNGATDEQMREWTARLRYSVAARSDFQPPPAELALDGVGIQRRSDRSILYGSLGAAGFIATDLPQIGFWQQFPTELRRDYQLIMLLALQQRHALLALGALVSDRWLNTDIKDRVTQFGQIQDQLQYLSARLMPVHVAQRNSQQRFYATMRGALEVNDLYSTVRQTVSDLSESLRLTLSEKQTEQQLRFEARVSLLALVFGLPSLALAFLAINMRGIATPLPLIIVVIVIVTSFGIGFAASRVIARRSSS